MIHNEMAPFKSAASQARSSHQYKNLKIKVLKYNADIFFNRQCLSKKDYSKLCEHKGTDYVPSFTLKKKKTKPPELKTKSSFYIRARYNPVVIKYLVFACVVY